MNVAGNTHVVTQIAKPTANPIVAFSHGCADSSRSSEGAERNPPKINST